MNIRIYQVNHERDVNNTAFFGYEMLEKLQGKAEINSDIYDCVFAGEVDCNNLEDVYQMFNLNHPQGYKGRSLSVSDIVEVRDSNDKSEFYFCDSVGFISVDFDKDKINTIKENTIRVLMVEPGKKAYEKEIGTSLDDMYAALDCDCIQAVYPYSDLVAIVCDDEGKLKHSKPNRAIYDSHGSVSDIICGKFFVCDCSKPKFKSLPHDMMKKYKKQFLLPERFISVNDEIFAIKYDPAREAAR